MEHISRKLESINTDCCFVDKIKTNKYLEKINDKANLKKYNNFLFFWIACRKFSYIVC